MASTVRRGDGTASISAVGAAHNGAQRILESGRRWKIGVFTKLTLEGNTG